MKKHVSFYTNQHLMMKSHHRGAHSSLKLSNFWQEFIGSQFALAMFSLYFPCQRLGCVDAMLIHFDHSYLVPKSAADVFFFWC